MFWYYMSIIHYYDLKDYNASNLPKNLKFVDPYDGSVYVTKENDSLKSFIDQINLTRTPPLLLTSTLTTTLIIASLAESASSSQLETYFKKMTSLPTTSQIVGIAKALAYETLHDNTVSLKQTTIRASKCLNCPFHGLPNSKSPHLASPFVSLLNTLSPTTTTQPTPSLPNTSHAYDLSVLDKVGTCKLCGCPLKAKIRYQLQAILASLTPEMLETAITMLGLKTFDVCWIFNECSTPTLTPDRDILTKKLRLTRTRGDVLLETYISKQKALKEAQTK